MVAADANPVVAYDGDTCSYDGPTLLEEGEVESNNDPAGLPMPNGMIWLQSNIEPGATSASHGFRGR